MSLLRQYPNANEKFILTDEFYYKYLDGKPRRAGIIDAFNVLGIKLSEAEISEIGRLKDETFLRLLTDQSPTQLIYEDFAKVRESSLLREGKRYVGTSSRNGQRVISLTQLEDFFLRVYDGHDVDKHQLTGKPAPDLFNHIIEEQNLIREQTYVIEDSVSGVFSALRCTAEFVIWVQRSVLPTNLFESNFLDLMQKNLKSGRLAIVRSLHEFFGD
jgi:beta-phosphoglucomutase-like phosphatase (HAD superfamily)